jgi:hypothetical protein
LIRLLAPFAAWLVVLALGCAGAPLVEPGRSATRGQDPHQEFADAEFAERDQLVLHANFDLPRDHRMIAELVAERGQIAEALDLSPGAEPIHIHLFADREAYRRYVAEQFPDFPERRAIFVETEDRLAVYAHWGRNVAEDLRHETAHGYLHAAVPNIPLWLDEGLAEYFEVGRERHGLNQPHVDLLRGQLATAPWRPELHRLELLESAPAMTQLDYAESWLWVHWLLADESRAACLQEYLSDLERGLAEQSLGQRVKASWPDAEVRLLEHLTSLAKPAEDALADVGD